jgi:hypothetical protein
MCCSRNRATPYKMCDSVAPRHSTLEYLVDTPQHTQQLRGLALARAALSDQVRLLGRGIYTPSRMGCSNNPLRENFCNWASDSSIAVICNIKAAHTKPLPALLIWVPNFERSLEIVMCTAYRDPNAPLKNMRRCKALPEEKLTPT